MLGPCVASIYGNETGPTKNSKGGVAHTSGRMTTRSSKARKDEERRKGKAEEEEEEEEAEEEEQEIVIVKKKTKQAEKQKVEEADKKVEEADKKQQQEEVGKKHKQGREEELEKLEVEIFRKVESGLRRMEKRFEEKCIDIARKVETDRRKVMEDDLGRYKREMEGLMRKAVANDDEAPTKRHTVAKPTADMVTLATDACCLLEKDLSEIKPVVTEDVGDWGSDVSDHEVVSMEQTPNNSKEKVGLHETVHELILLMQELPAPTHEALDGLWVTMSKRMNVDGPTRTDIENIEDRQAALVRIMIVLHDKVSEEAMRTRVSPDKLYSNSQHDGDDAI